MSSENEADLQEDERYLVFSLNGIFYASPLLAVREVIEFTTPKPVPNLQKECLGVINLRGKIVPVFEMSKVSGKERGDFSVGPYFMMVVESGKGSAACVVDKIEAVTDFPESVNELVNPTFFEHFRCAKIVVSDLRAAENAHVVSFPRLGF